ncbi:MAG: PLDc N-terminal domain-containing protein [Candidatus Aenigmatarchaeota archaeon]
MAFEDFAFNGSDSVAMQQMATTFAPLMIAVIAIIMVLAVLCFALWLWMIIDCAKRKKFQNGDNVMWILLLVLTGPIGMVLYYFMEVRRGSDRKGK